MSPSVHDRQHVGLQLLESVVRAIDRIFRAEHEGAGRHHVLDRGPLEDDARRGEIGPGFGFRFAFLPVGDVVIARPLGDQQGVRPLFAESLRHPIALPPPKATMPELTVTRRFSLPKSNSISFSV